MSKKLSLEQKIANQKARLAKLESLKSKNVANNTAEPSKEKIKVGDRVMVIDPTGNLTKNKIYTVTNVDKFYDDISVINDAGNNIAYFAYRFKLVSKEEEKKPITVKPNDYVVCIDQNGGGFVFGNVYLCDSRTIPDHVGVEKDSNGKQNGWSSHFFRFATNDEIYNYLLKEANDRGIKVGVINVNGRVFMEPLECPFKAALKAAEELAKETKVIIVDIHAEATSEKVALGWYLDGKVSAIFSTHTHIQTADEKILPKGTAYISDVGMTGPYDSVIGRRIDDVLTRFLSSIPVKLEVAEENIQLHGALVEIDETTGKANSILRVQKKL